MIEKSAPSLVTDAGSALPEREEIYRVVAERTRNLIAEQGALLREVACEVLAGDRHILNERPGTLWPVVVIQSCASAGGNWRKAIWPAVALEIAMVAADVFDDVADDDETDSIARFGRATVLTTAVGLLTLAGSAMLRVVEDGCAETVAVRLGRLLGDSIAAAADGQARGLGQVAVVGDVVDAYRLAAGKSGPLGELAARLGATIATEDAGALDLYGAFGWHFAVYGQLVNDALDAAPVGSAKKGDVRQGSPTVPLVFTRSTGAPKGLDETTLISWERAERQRIADEGGIVLTEVLAIADRLRAEGALAALDALGHATRGLHDLLVGRDHGG